MIKILEIIRIIQIIKIMEIINTSKIFRIIEILGQIECSVCSYWTTMDKREFTHWSEVNRMFGCGEIAIFQQRMTIWKMRPQTFSNRQD